MSYHPFATTGDGMHDILTCYSEDIPNSTYDNNVDVKTKMKRCDKRSKDKGKRYQCTFCNMELINASNLNSHIRTHTKEKPFNCNQCPLSFTQHSNLKSHMRTHSGIKPFSCTDCSKKFARSSHLIGHQRLHTGKMPFTCEMCTKKFYTSTRLKKHQKEKHQNGSLFLCGICEESFLYESALRLHATSHVGERPFKCTICSASLRSKEDLNIHNKLHFGASAHRYQCPKCGKKYQIKLCCEMHGLSCTAKVTLGPPSDSLPQGNIVVSSDPLDISAASKEVIIHFEEESPQSAITHDELIEHINFLDFQDVPSDCEVFDMQFKQESGDEELLVNFAGDDSDPLNINNYFTSEDPNAIITHKLPHSFLLA